MKFTILLITLIVQVTITAGQVTFFPKAGVVAAKIQGERAVDPEYEFDNKLGFAVGGVIMSKLNKRFVLQGELLFIQKGGKSYYYYGPQPSQGTIDHSLRLNYIEVPVVLRMAVGRSERLYIHLGPFAGIALNGKSKFYHTAPGGGFLEEETRAINFGGTPSNVGDTVFDHYIEGSFDYGFHLGIGINFNKFLFDFRYGQSLPSLSKESDDTSAAMQFTIGVPIKKK